MRKREWGRSERERETRAGAWSLTRGRIVTFSTIARPSSISRSIRASALSAAAAAAAAAAASAASSEISAPAAPAAPRSVAKRTSAVIEC